MQAGCTSPWCLKRTEEEGSILRGRLSLRQSWVALSLSCFGERGQRLHHDLCRLAPGTAHPQPSGQPWASSTCLGSFLGKPGSERLRWSLHYAMQEINPVKPEFLLQIFVHRMSLAEGTAAEPLLWPHGSISSQARPRPCDSQRLGVASPSPS